MADEEHYGEDDYYGPEPDWEPPCDVGPIRGSVARVGEALEYFGLRSVGDIAVPKSTTHLTRDG